MTSQPNSQPKWNRIYGTKLIESVTIEVDRIPVNHVFQCKSCNNLIDLQDPFHGEEMAEKLGHKCATCHLQTITTVDDIPFKAESLVEELCRNYIEKALLDKQLAK